MYYSSFRRRTALVTPIDRMRRLKSLVRMISDIADFKTEDDPSWHRLVRIVADPDSRRGSLVRAVPLRGARGCAASKSWKDGSSCPRSR
jgi:hypothetical protein